jgi:hypothetical protein
MGIRRDREQTEQLSCLLFPKLEHFFHDILLLITCMIYAQLLHVLDFWRNCVTFHESNHPPRAQASSLGRDSPLPGQQHAGVCTNVTQLYAFMMNGLAEITTVTPSTRFVDYNFNCSESLIQSRNF